MGKSTIESEKNDGREAWISADTHFYEPADLWTARLPKSCRYQAMRTTHHKSRFKNGVDHQWMPGQFSFGLGRSAHIDGGPNEFKLDDSDDVFSKVDRDMAADGVSGAMVHSHLGLLACFVSNHPLALAHARVYNDYVVEVFGRYFDRYAPMANIPLTDIGDAVAEIGRVASMGIRGIQIPSFAPCSI